MDFYDIWSEIDETYKDSEEFLKKYETTCFDFKKTYYFCQENCSLLIGFKPPDYDSLWEKCSDLGFIIMPTLKDYQYVYRHKNDTNIINMCLKHKGVRNEIN